MLNPGSQKLKSIATALLVPLNTLLLFLVLFENRIRIPAWLQVAGRMHPMVLHFPIVLLLAYFAWLLLLRKDRLENPSWRLAGEIILMTGALSAVVTALMGLFLSKEPGYDPETMQWHKWSGIITAVLASAWYGWHRFFLERNGAIRMSGTVVMVIFLLSGAHQGAGITHGKDFLWAPVIPEKKEPRVSMEEAVVFTHLVQPILKNRCMGCHNSEKAKGDLLMQTREQLLTGGKHGKLWDTTAADLGLMLRRIHLPAEQKKHMPPAGKPQLTETEMQILYWWIKDGASFDKMVRDLPPKDSLYRLALAMLNSREGEEFDFEAAAENTIRKLNNSNRVLYPLAMESPALAVDFYNREFFTPESLRELLEVKDQLVSINCAHMPLKDEDLSVIGQFRNLRKLNLNFTGVNGSGLKQLEKLKNLRDISLAGNPISADKLEQLEKIPALQSAYIWNTSPEPAQLEAFRKREGRLRFETGFRSDTLLLKLTPPILQNEELVISRPVPLKLKHFIQGTLIRYTFDGSEPDSLNSPVYDEKVMISQSGELKARAFKAGWLGSDLLQQYFFQSTYPADSVVLLSKPDPKYMNARGHLLADLEKGDFNFNSGKWIGYRGNPMEILLIYREPREIKNITLSLLKSTGSYIMPPVSVEIRGGESLNAMNLLGKAIPVQPTKDEPSSYLPIDISFSPHRLKYIRIKAVPVPGLPAWHPGKGDKGWIFIDEVFVN